MLRVFSNFSPLSVSSFVESGGQEELQMEMHFTKKIVCVAQNVFKVDFNSRFIN